MTQYSRRDWLTLAAAVGVLPRARRLGFGTPLPGIDEFIQGVMRARAVPGVAAVVIKGGSIVWSRGYGWANIAKRIPMSPDHTIQNIASVSKTVTATAVMQLFEQRKFGLDDDVNRFLPFPVRNPHHLEVPITFRQLLTHRSGIADGPSYEASYGCGDPTMDLRTWLESYLTPKGRFYDANRNFQPWVPGTQGKLEGAIGRNYSNVGFGLLGFLVSQIAAVPFPRYCRDRIFTPLGMIHTGWLLSEIDRSSHAVPYARASDSASAPGKAAQASGLLGRQPERADTTNPSFLPYCLYSFPNFPDGSVRTSVKELGQFLLAYINQGAGNGQRILAPETVAMMLSPQVETEPRQGLCWFGSERGGVRYWGHDGGDPGVATTMSFRPSDGVGVIVFATRTSGVGEISNRLFDEAATLEGR